MKKRPHLKPAKKQTDVFADYFSTTLLVILWVYLFGVFPELPEKVAIHFNAIGEADRYSSKENILLLPGIATFIFIGLKILSRYPHLFNYPVKITEENASRNYALAVRLLTFVNLAMVIAFAIISFEIIAESKNISFLKGWLLPVVITLIMAPTIFFTIKIFRDR